MHKTTRIRLGEANHIPGKYENGCFTMDVLTIHGDDAASVLLAEKVRAELLEQAAGFLYQQYSGQRQRELNQLFRLCGVTKLSELIAYQLQREQFFLLSLGDAAEILRAEALLREKQQTFFRTWQMLEEAAGGEE